MKLSDLIAKLSQYPGDTEVAIFDSLRVDKEADFENGVYFDFEVHLDPGHDDEDEQFKREPFVMLTFENNNIFQEDESFKSSFDKLTDLQLAYGYERGVLTPVAVLGLFGEAGEVLDEVAFLHTKGRERYRDKVDTTHPAAVQIGKIVDKLKKEFRKNPTEAPEPFVIDEEAGFDLELADVVYYANLCALGRGNNLEYYAQLSAEKVTAKGLKAPALHPVDEKYYIYINPYYFEETLGEDWANGEAGYRTSMANGMMDKIRMYIEHDDWDAIRVIQSVTLPGTNLSAVSIIERKQEPAE